MDEIDDRILSILATNGRASFAAIGAEVGLSPHGTADRIRRLERDKVITGYSARIDPAGVGRSVNRRMRSSCGTARASRNSPSWSSAASASDRPA